jgi:hypothetical protein
VGRGLSGCLLVRVLRLAMEVEPRFYFIVDEGRSRLLKLDTRQRARRFLLASERRGQQYLGRGWRCQGGESLATLSQRGGLLALGVLRLGEPHLEERVALEAYTFLGDSEHLCRGGVDGLAEASQSIDHPWAARRVEDFARLDQLDLNLRSGHRGRLFHLFS